MKIKIFLLILLAFFLFPGKSIAAQWKPAYDGGWFCRDKTTQSAQAWADFAPSFPIAPSCVDYLSANQSNFVFFCVNVSAKIYTCDQNYQKGCVAMQNSASCKSFAQSYGLKPYVDPAVKAAEQKATEEKQAAEAEAKKQAAAIQADKQAASSMVCDCSKTPGMVCRDDFTSTIEAQEYCQSCGIEMPKSGECALGTKEIGPFFCSCGTGDKQQCTTYDNYAELTTQCPKTCAVGNGPCATVDTGLTGLQSQASKVLNKAGFFTGTTGFKQLIAKIIDFLIWPIGMFAMIFYLWSGFLWMSGESEKIEKAKTTIAWTTIGIVATLSSYLIVQFVFKALQ
jgi:hypothetical protein